MRRILLYLPSIATMLTVIGCSEESLPSKAPTPNAELRTLTFEDCDAQFAPYVLDYASREIMSWSDLVDDKQYDGVLLYGDYEEHIYEWHDKNNTELAHNFLTPYWAGGGHALSNYIIEDYAALPDGCGGWHELQLATPNGGHNSSKNFAVHNGYIDSYNAEIYNSKLATLHFADGVERVINHMWIMNTSYVLNSLYYGNDYCPKATASTHLNIVAEGFDAADRCVGRLTFALCDGGELITEWTKWELASLGKVAKITFNFEASDDLKGEYGLLCPAYFAYDDVAVRFAE